MVSDAITVIQLPAGPTAYFKLTSVQLGSQIYVSAWALDHCEVSVYVPFTGTCSTVTPFPWVNIAMIP